MLPGLPAAPTAGEPARGRPASRRLPVGLEPTPAGAHARVWAPGRRTVEIVVAGRAAAPLAPEPGGYWSGAVPGGGPGDRYAVRLDGGPPRPDPASRFQPEGPHAPSQIVDPAAFAWSDAAWRGLTLGGQVLYELHVGTFTPEGTWSAAGEQLAALADLGVTCVELMPVMEFAGRFGWGYDGVDLYAPAHVYGTPDEMRAYVDRAHALGLGVILDVVYNHCGPDGCYLREFSPAYFSTRYTTEWGEPLNYDGEDSGPVRELVVENAGYWVSEFHLDGLRLDATQVMFDASPEHVLAAIARRARQAAAPREIILVAENEPQQVRLVRPPERGGYGLDALWNDDFHHSATVALTGRSEAYYTDHAGRPQEFVSAAKHGYLFQGQHYAWQKKPRGTPARGIAPAAFVCFLENHDQVANSADGARLHALTSPGRWRAMTGLLLLGPWTPMLFQGQEFASSRPFLYFADHVPELAQAVRRGRAEFLLQFPSIGDRRELLDDPADPGTFQRCKLDPGERALHGDAVALHGDLLAIRRGDPVLARQGRDGVDGAVLADEAFLLRFADPAGDDRVLVVNLGPDLELRSAPEPLLAPPEGAAWSVAWSSEDARYGGRGTAVRLEGGFRFQGRAAVLLRPGTSEGADGRHEER